MKPLLSVITINHNNAAGLERTIMSVRNQAGLGLEYIIVDGASTDGSAEIIKNSQASINAWVSESDRGIFHAMNKGIAMSNGTYLLFLNSGDEFNGNSALSEAVAQLENHDLVTCNLILVSENSETLKVYPDFPTFKYLLNDSLPHPATFIKKTLFEKTGGYNESLKICSDWEFFLIALCKLNATHKHLPLILSRFYLGGISSTEENREFHLAERAAILQNHFARFNDMIRSVEEKEQIDDIIAKSRLIKIARKFGLLKALDLVGKH